MSDTLEFEWLGRHVRLRSDSPELLEQVFHLWGSTPAGPPGSASETREYEAILESPAGMRFRGPGGETTLDPVVPRLHAYNLFVTELLGAVSECFVFHGTVVSRDGRAIVVSGPTTFGKTTLGIHLATRGFALLADDVCILERASGRVIPFTRPLRLRPGARAMLPAAALAAAEQAVLARQDDDWIVDSARWPGAARSPAIIGMAVILRPEADGAGVRQFPRYEVRARRERREILEELRTVAGVTGEPQYSDHGTTAHVLVNEVGPLLQWLRKRRADLVYAVKHTAEPPRFDGRPRLEPISRFQAAIELGQEMQNRHDDSRVGREFADREVLLVVEIANLLRDARCLALTPGRLDESVDAIVAAFEETTRR